MRMINSKILLATVLAVTFLSFSSHSDLRAEYIDNTEIEVLPLRYAFVDGYQDKFRAHHWMNDGYAAGLKEFYTAQTISEDTILKMEGKAIPQNNEFEGMVEINKKNVGYTKFEYKEFRKYYDRRGAVYRRFEGLYRDLGAPLWYGEANKELALDIGQFGVEAGLRKEGFPHLTFGYEREFRDGAKSRLTWGTVTNVAGLSRKIAPAYADIKEIVDKFDVEIDHTVKGVELISEQTWEQVRIDQTRTELQFSQNWDTNATNKYILKQHIKPESKSFNSVWKAAKWFSKDRIYTSAGYRFNTLKNQEWEDTREFDQYLNLMSTGNFSENRFNNRAENSYHSNTWVQNIAFIPVKWLNFGMKLKEEYFNRRGESTYNIETTNPPDNRVNRFEVSDTKYNAQRIGESFSVRFAKIPRTALYSELEFEQMKGPLNEDRISVGGQSAPAAGEEFTRETLTYIQKGGWTLGMRAVPISFIDFTSHFRRSWKGTDYDDIRESPPVGGAKSAFFDNQDLSVNEFMSRLAFKLTKFFQPALRYIFRETRYDTAVEEQPSVLTGIDSNNFIVDITSQPLNELIAIASFSRLGATTWTPGKDFFGAANTPEFDSNVNTWSFSLNYAPQKVWSWINTIRYSRADNFNDFADTGLPLGADYRMIDLESGFKFALLQEKLILEPKYALYHYNANDSVDSGDYSAHVLSFEITLPWG